MNRVFEASFWNGVYYPALPKLDYPGLAKKPLVRSWHGVGLEKLRGVLEDRLGLGGEADSGALQYTIL